MSAAKPLPPGRGKIILDISCPSHAHASGCSGTVVRSSPLPSHAEPEIENSALEYRGSKREAGRQTSRDELSAMCRVEGKAVILGRAPAGNHRHYCIQGSDVGVIEEIGVFRQELGPDALLPSEQ